MTTYTDLRSTDPRARLHADATADYPVLRRTTDYEPHSRPGAPILWLFVAWCVILAAVGWWLAGWLLGG